MMEEIDTSYFEKSQVETEKEDVEDARKDISRINRNEAFQEVMHELREDLNNNPVLRTLAKGEFSPDQWRTFAIQRYLAAKPFEALLEAAMKKSRERDSHVAAAIQRNLEDERGIKNKKAVPELSHEKWRKDFYTAIGISEDELQNSQMLPGTREYCETLNKLIEAEDEDYLLLVGAIVALEGTIPGEFAKIKFGRDMNFRDLPQKARLYVDSHIENDSKSHYPELLNSLRRHVTINGQLNNRLMQGIEIMRDAKRKFYQSLEQELGLSQQ